MAERRYPLGAFYTNRNQLYIAWTQVQLDRAIRLGWTSTEGWKE